MHPSFALYNTHSNILLSNTNLLALFFHLLCFHTLIILHSYSSVFLPLSVVPPCVLTNSLSLSKLSSFLLYSSYPLISCCFFTFAAYSAHSLPLPFLSVVMPCTLYHSFTPLLCLFSYPSLSFSLSLPHVIPLSLLLFL